MVDMNIAKGIARNHRRIELFDAAPIFSAPFHPIPAADPLPIQLALYSWRDPQLSAAPHSVHLMREVSSKFG